MADLTPVESSTTPQDNGFAQELMSSDVDSIPEWMSDLRNAQWISSDVSREEAMQCLEDNVFSVGSFIIHRHQSVVSQLELSVKVSSTGVSHYEIVREDHKLRIDLRDESFNTLTELVQGCAENNSRSMLKFSIKKNKAVLPWNCEVTVGNMFDGGSFGLVYFGTLSDNRTVALKALLQACESKEDLMREAEISRECDHPNVLNSVGICESWQHHRQLHLIVTGYLPGGNLKNYLKSHFFLKPSECISIAQKIANGMAYLVSMGIVHRDLAARNILVGETSDVIKIADFGLSRNLVDGYYKTIKDVFPPAWTAPEGFVLPNPENPFVPLQKGTLTHKSDMWSFGIVLWELYSNGDNPYPGIARGDRYEDRVNLYNALTEKGLRPTRPVKCPRVIYAKMRECWLIERKKRPTFGDMHLFLSGLSIEETLFPLVPDVPATLVSSDKQNFNVSSGILTRSATICAGSYIISNKIHIPNVKGPILSLVIDWLSKHKEMEEPNHDVDSTFDQVFIRAIDQPTLLKLRSAAKYLGIDGLKSLIGDSIAHRLRHSTDNINAGDTRVAESPTAMSAQSSGRKILKSVHGSYLRAIERDWKVDMVHGPPRELENWQIEDWRGKVVLKGRGAPDKPGQFLRAMPDGSVDLTGTHPKDDQLAIWQPFKNKDGSWSFLSATNGTWLSAHSDGSVCTVKNCDSWAHFTLDNW